jgi:hypothetical protein
MKHLITFESFVDINNSEINEWLGQKFITGHGPGEKEEAKKRIESEIEKLISEIQIKIEEKPSFINQFPQFKNIETLKSSLLKKAQENGYKGEVKLQKSPDGDIYLIYKSGMSGLQHIGSAAGAFTGGGGSGYK